VWGEVAQIIYTHASKCKNEKKKDKTKQTSIMCIYTTFS
jgi:hypothetical protein